MATKSKAKKMRAVASFGAEVDGKERVVHQGDVFPADHAVVKGREELFEQLKES
jgi:hypothetical protein